MLTAAVCLTLLAVVVAWSLPRYREHRNELYRCRSRHPSTRQSTHVRLVDPARWTVDGRPVPYPSGQVYDQDADR